MAKIKLVENFVTKLGKGTLHVDSVNDLSTLIIKNGWILHKYTSGLLILRRNIKVSFTSLDDEKYDYPEEFLGIPNVNITFQPGRDPNYRDFIKNVSVTSSTTSFILYKNKTTTSFIEEASIIIVGFYKVIT